MHGKIAAGYFDRSMQDYDSCPFVKKDMKCVLHDFDMRCTYEMGWQPCGDEDKLLRFYRFEGQPAAVIPAGQPEGHRRYCWTLCNGKTHDPYTLVSRQVPDDLCKNLCESRTDIIIGIVLLFYHEPHLHPGSDDSLL
jgi:hypothetical protein